MPLSQINHAMNGLNQFALLIAAMLTLSGCMLPNSLPVRTDGSETPDLPPLSISSKPIPYRLQTGDLLDIRFFYNKELNQQAVVRPDGKITLQLIQEVQAAGVTPATLQKRLEERYKGILRLPEIAVIVTAFTPSIAYVAGEVNEPGELEITPMTNVLQAIIKRGGFTLDAAIENVIVIRHRDQQQPQFIPIDLGSFLRQGAAFGHRASRQSEGDQTQTSYQPAAGVLAKNIRVEPFDIVFVPQMKIAGVAQFFQRYVSQILPIYRNMGLTFTYELRTKVPE